MGATSDRSPSLPTEELLERQVLRKVTLRLIPFLCLLYFVNILDRVNVAFARLRMPDTLGITEEFYGLGAGIFFIGYCLLEVPSNLILSRIGARRWIARILVSWGLISTATMFVGDPWSFCVLRFLLGCAEAGFFPGVVLYLTYWFPARQRARAVARLMAASPLVWVVGGPLSGLLMEHLDGLAGLADWQWLFLVEGLPAVVLGGVTLAYLTDRPEDATWLTAEERAWLTWRLAAEERPRAGHHGLSFLQATGDPRVWHLIALAVTLALCISGFSYYFPLLVQDGFPRLSPVGVGLLTAASGACAFLTILAVGALSDRTGRRRGCVVALALLGAAGWGLSAWREAAVVSFLGLVIAQAAMLSIWGPFWSLTTARLGSRAAAGGIALINALANLGAFFGPNIMAGLRKATGDYAAGLAALALTLVLTALLAWCVRPPEQVTPGGA
jgi:ACS family tartrate transporter-like MFS transporter